MDWAARTPHISPAWARACTNRASTSPTSQSKAARFSRCSNTTFRAAKVDRTNITNNCVASSASAAAAAVASGDCSLLSPTSLLHVRIRTQRRVTPSSTTLGSKTAVSNRSPHSNCFCAAHTNLSRFTGNCAKGSASLSGSRQAKIARSASRSPFNLSSSASNNVSKSGSARHAAATSTSRATPWVTGPCLSLPSARLME
mmetsp:Transcript_25098/g.65227  ORF Transcript_25098/g.65227 Transcript_25098/m.65227 type:complete len:200 (+) Transcript_25098:1729-2328(+)